ncbi:A24 family peptidase [Caproicibacter sp. BJN0012]|uniref:A24 family peptidase n=1 Tax=Caproicibacter sp. BJN0012 TaxID=3110227 RepID=UPI002E1592DA
MPADSVAQTALFCCLLLAASVWDIRKRIVPDTLCVLIFCLGLRTLTPDKLFGVLLALPLLIAALIKEGGMGGGDIKLTAAAGFVLGLPAGTVGLILGLTAVLGYYLADKGIRKLKKSETQAAGEHILPLAPFLSAGFIAAYIMNLGGSIL